MRSNQGSQNTSARAFSLYKRVVALVLIFSAPALHSPTLHADEVDTVCGSTLNAPHAAATPGGAADPKGEANQQKLQYCQAARDAQDAADANSAMWKVWAAVGVICTYACVASFAGGPTSQFLCAGATLGGGITDAIVTKNFTTALMSLGTTGAGLGANAAINGSSKEEVAKEGTKETAKKTEKDIGACLNAAMAVMQTFMKHKSMQDSQASADSSLASAKAVVTPAGNTAADTGASMFAAQQNSGLTGSGSGSGSNSNGGTPVGQGQTIGANGPSSCSGQSAGTTSATAVLQCAMASDRNLPGFLGDSKFPQEFQNDSGKSLASFLGGNGPPGPMMAGAMGKGMSGTQASTIASAVDGVGQAVGTGDYTRAIYAGGGGGNGGGGSGGDDSAAQMGAMMQGLMDQMNPNKAKDQTTTGVSAVIFANQHRGPAAVVEDRRLSIFDRITYRYYYVGRRIVLGEGEPR